MTSYIEQVLKYTHAKDVALASSAAAPASETIVDKTAVTGSFALDDVNQHVILGARNGGNAVTLPQATADNVGRTITICFAADCGVALNYIGLATAGSTVMTGGCTVTCKGGGGATEASEETSAYQPCVSGAKSLSLDSDSPGDTAGGAQGSTYTFTYYGANTVFVQGEGYVTAASFDSLNTGVTSTGGV